MCKTNRNGQKKNVHNLKSEIDTLKYIFFKTITLKIKQLFVYNEKFYKYNYKNCFKI